MILHVADAVRCRVQAQAYTAVPSAPPANEQVVSIPIGKPGRVSSDEQPSSALDRSRFRKPHAAGN